MTAVLAPKPVRRDTDLGRVLRALEAECTLADIYTCPYERPDLLRADEEAEASGVDEDTQRHRTSSGLPVEYRLLLAVFGALDQPLSEPCHHCEDADHGLSLEDWLALLRRYDPGHDGPGADPRGGRALLLREVRVAMYEVRAGCGWALFHPADTHTRDGVGALGVAGRRDAIDSQGGLCLEGEAGHAADPRAAWEAGGEVTREEMARLCGEDMAGWGRFRRKATADGSAT